MSAHRHPVRWSDVSDTPPEPRNRPLAPSGRLDLTRSPEARAKARELRNARQTKASAARLARQVGGRFA